MHLQQNRIVSCTNIDIWHGSVMNVEVKLKVIAGFVKTGSVKYKVTNLQMSLQCRFT